MTSQNSRTDATRRVEKVGRQSEADPFEFVLSDDSVDRVGDIVEADGWQLANFKANPIALWQHDHNMPIGTWKNVRVQENRLLGRLHLAQEGTSRFIDMVRSLIEQRIIRAISVGFLPLEWDERRDAKQGFLGIRFTKHELLEASAVSVPANANALAIARSLSLDALEVRQLFAPDALARVPETELRSFVIAPASQQMLHDMPRRDALARAAAAATKADSVLKGARNGPR